MKVLVRIYGIPYRGKHVMPLELSEYIGQYVLLEGTQVKNMQGNPICRLQFFSPSAISTRSGEPPADPDTHADQPITKEEFERVFWETGRQFLAWMQNQAPS